MSRTEQTFSKMRCVVCWVWGIVDAAVTVVALVSVIVMLAMSGCHETSGSGCGIVFAAVPYMASFYVLLPLGLISLLFRVVSFRTSGVRIPAQYYKLVKLGQKLLLAPLLGIPVSFMIGLLASMVVGVV